MVGPTSCPHPAPGAVAFPWHGWGVLPGDTASGSQLKQVSSKSRAAGPTDTAVPKEGPQSHGMPTRQEPFWE